MTTRTMRAHKLFLSAVLTLGCLAGALEAGVLRTAAAQAQLGCTNTECEGVIRCRYAPRYNCGFSSDGLMCTNTVCARQAEP